jgi:hypothetical protein
MDDFLALVKRSLDPETRPIFAERVADQAELVRSALAGGSLESEDFAIGMEVETYATHPDGTLSAIPSSVFGDGVAKELGVHNAELNTDASRFDPDGLAEQRDALARAVGEASERVAATDRELVLDAMWTIPPAEGSRRYLSALEDAEDVTVAANMRPSPRYTAIDNEVLGWADGSIDLSLPGVDVSFPTILCESLTSSIQPHLQIPSVEAYPRYFNAAIRTMGPVLSLSTNSPFVPADLYEAADPHGVVEATPHECRIPVFEDAINVDDGPRKVRVPRDIETPTDVADRLVEDRTCAPFLREWLEDHPPEDFTEQFWELDHKRGTFWRWVRTVVGGQAVEGAGDGRSLRIEYRPLPTQPSVPDTVGLQCLVAGLLRGIVETDHPLCELEWDPAREAFYDAVDRGPAAELAWITAGRERTDDAATIYADCFDLATTGLEAAGIDADTAASLLDPIRRRVDGGTVPSQWKKDRVREHLADGDDLSAAIERMQREYVERSEPTTPFVDW